MAKIDSYCALGVDREYNLTESSLLAALDAAGVDRAVVVPVDRCLAVHNREGNDAMLRAAAAHPERFIPACSVNPWYGSDAENELRLSIDMGARMLVLHPLVQGFQSNDELVRPVLDIAAEAKLPVYVHTGPPGNSTPWQVVDLAQRYPSLDIIMGHCGATDFWNDVVDAARCAGNICLESSLARPFAFSGYVKAMGDARGIMGSFAPLNDLSFEWDQMRKTLPENEWPGVYGGTLRRLLEKRGAL